MNGQVVDFDFELIDDPVILLDAQRKIVIPFRERAERFIDRRLGAAGHRQQFLLQPVQFHIEVFHSRRMIQPNRPVT